MARALQYEWMVPRSWYNIVPDLPKPLPPYLKPNGEPVAPHEFEILFAKELVRQEFSKERWIPIPTEVRDVYLIWRPTPLIRAKRLEALLKTPARIYYKFEGVSPPGSHKPNTAVAQLYYVSREGVQRVTTETGAGQWGSSVAFAASLFGVKATVYMVRASYTQKPYRRVLMELWGAEVAPSPSDRTEAGRKYLAEDPSHPGSLGIAISEAVEDAVRSGAKYVLGSVLNHVLIHQTVIGLEALEQIRYFGDYPDYVVGACGGGSSFSGLFWPFYYEKKAGKAEKDVKFLAVEPAAVPTLTRGEYLYDFGDTAGLTPLIKMHTVGHTYKPPPIHAGGLRYHGCAPTLSLLVEEGEVGAAAYRQTEVFEAARLFAAAEGVVPAPESAHAVKAAVELALKAKREGTPVTILFNMSGHGLLDLSAYDEYLRGAMADAVPTAEELAAHIAKARALTPSSGPRG
ncbi:TrpB-like pyridoxal phosphate-dependent enzyme [Pyrobaculum sp. 3827-6]|uniref:TrpB-like pyridoxal phosphate-dependent enzyme n=1 Tax=Pyrobaculum sp. 3827-6 TaxID=2983604 RepID=UPI0021D99EFB|nr:TrpB-like pyridoxal phosphate-dependent enzyme [Pyrobaculum sp. 3827-6]MCU7786958.1 TrpB-like pyridoxal phosphate-dependent enzyme [Pyrobaculum sp. 3827-6]